MAHMVYTLNSVLSREVLSLSSPTSMDDMDGRGNVEHDSTLLSILGMANRPCLHVGMRVVRSSSRGMVAPDGPPF